MCILGQIEGERMKNVTESKENNHDVIIVGAGAAGVGIGIVLKKMGIEHIILEKEDIGSSFRKWPQETRFISPSFTGNFFGMPDLNAISPDTSPAFSLLTEHPTGEEFAEYLVGISEVFDQNIEIGVEVCKVSKIDGLFQLETSRGNYTTQFLIWAAGEYQFPKKDSFVGAELCIQYSKIESFLNLQGDHFLIIGAYESGFDAYTHLVRAGKAVQILDGGDNIDLINSDSSYSLSPFTRDRIKETLSPKNYFKDARVTKVEFLDGKYVVSTQNNKTFTSVSKPIDCTGFEGSLALVKNLFEFDERYPYLNERDESTITEHLFLVGPFVKHRNALFCFIYKYRKRFAIVGETIAKALNIDPETVDEVLEEYKLGNFYLDDLSCCDNECVC
jgi:putative flavoprotein involved in K+ transport